VDRLNDDRYLVERMLAGDERAFSTFFDEYFPRVYRFALPRLNRDGELAKDVVQATLIKAVRGLPGFRGEAALFSWLCRICRREIADELRVRRRQSAQVVLVEDEPEVRAALESIGSPESDDPLLKLDAVELQRLVHAVLDRLPGRYGEALEWKYIEGRSVEEIGDRLGIGTTAAQSLLARARVAFRGSVETVFGVGRRRVVQAGDMRCDT
jgi:RNA polymerase sigma-70 factor, ECF subfamily